MKRALLRLTTSLSLMLCAATAVLWACSRSAYWGLALDHYRIPVDWEDLDIAGYRPGDVGWNLRREFFCSRGTIGLHQLRLCPGLYDVPDGPRRTVGWHLDAYCEPDPDD